MQASLESLEDGRENDYHKFTSSEEEEMMIDELERLILFSVLLDIT